MAEVFKESEYYENFSGADPSPAAQTPFGNWESHVFNGVEGLKSDFGEVIAAGKKFPVRSALTVIGFLTVLYIGFRISKSFVKIKNRLRG